MISLLASNSEDLIGGLVWLVVSGVVGVLRMLIFSSPFLPFLPSLCSQGAGGGAHRCPLPPYTLALATCGYFENVVFSSFSVLLEMANLTFPFFFFFCKTKLKKNFFPQSRPPAISEIVNRSQCQGISGRF